MIYLFFLTVWLGTSDTSYSHYLVLHWDLRQSVISVHLLWCCYLSLVLDWRLIIDLINLSWFTKATYNSSIVAYSISVNNCFWGKLMHLFLERWIRSHDCQIILHLIGIINLILIKLIEWLFRSWLGLMLRILFLAYLLILNGKFNHFILLN